MKQKGFLFDINKCTGCGACMIACKIERAALARRSGGADCDPVMRQGKNWRRVYTFNESRHPALPVFNFSLACNHCGEPVCLRNCPARAYSKDEKTGAVSLDGQKCMGCKYCTWVCPYDAPQFEPALGTTGKCNFCKERIGEGKEPACVVACPMGALQFTDLETTGELFIEQTAAPGNDRETAAIAGFTDAGINPAVRFIPLRRKRQPECTAAPDPAAIDKLFKSSLAVPIEKITLRKEWALLVFTTIAYLLAAFLTASLHTGKALNPFLFLGAGAAAMGLTFVHLGKKSRAYRALCNWRSSWLSREILFFSAFLGLSGIYLVFFPGLLALGWAAALAGFISLFSIDRIYQAAMKSGPLDFHSAHVLFNGFFLLGVLVKNGWLIGFFGFIKLYLYLFRKYRFKKSGRNVRPLTAILRLGFGFLFPAALLVFAGRWAHVHAWVTVSILIGEILDRSEYYSELDVITPEKQILKDLERLLQGGLFY